MKKLLFIATLALAGQAWATDYAGTYLDKKNAGNIAIKNIGNRYEFNIQVVNFQGHTGEITFTSPFSNGFAVYTTDSCDLKLTVYGKNLTVVQDHSKGTCDAGMNVTFDGIYKKNSQKSS